MKKRSRHHARTVLKVEALEERLVLNTDFYSVDGTGNNVANPDWGATNEQLIRLVSVDYGDGVSSPAGEDRPSARAISNEVVAATESIINDRYLTDLVWLWGQFVDHDLDLTENADPAEPFNIDVPTGDPFFDPFNTGTATIGLNRSNFDPTTGDSTATPRQQINQITAFLDGSVVYGSDAVRAAELRTFSGGRMKTSDGDLLPFNEAGLANAGGPSDSLFLAGDVRANENAALTAMQTLWVREHNRIADEIAADNPSLSDEEIYQQARRIVTAELQAITYNEFLPALLGDDAIDGYSGYDPNVNPGVSNLFSTAAYRFGHSMLSSDLLRIDADGNESTLALSDAFFSPDELTNHGIDSLLLGAASQQAQEIDTQLVDDVRNFLFGPPGAGGFDLASLNIQRGREHGLPSYNQARIDLGLAPAESFADITSDPELQAKLAAIYGDVDSVDAWVGGLAEDHVPGSSVGELVHTVLVDQFTRIRDGDRLWYQNTFSGDELREIENTTLADVIQRNTGITGLRDNVFYDDSVLYYKVDVGAAPLNATIRSQNGAVQIVDNRTGTVLASGEVDEVTKVHVVGHNQLRDRITIDFSNGGYQGEFQVHGGERGRDVLIVNGTPQSDEIIVGPNEIDVNGQIIAWSDIESITIEAGPGDDLITVKDNPPASVTVHGGPGNDRLVLQNAQARFRGGPGRDSVEDEGRREGPSRIDMMRAIMDEMFARFRR